MENNEKLHNIYLKCRENINSHVYLVETNSALKDIKNLIIMLNKDNNEVDVEKLINNDSLPTLSIVKPENQEIKIDVIEELIKKLQNIPVITNKNYFIICEAEKLNQKSGNSMLKIIEEPESDILGFFICNNISNIMQTIQSRSQYISLNYNLKVEYTEDVISDANLLFDYIHNGKSISENKYFVDKYKLIPEINNLLDCFITIEQKYINSVDNFDIIKLENLILLKIFEIKSNLNNNCNFNLLLDKFIIEVGRLK